jgi:hypothetical protein
MRRYLLRLAFYLSAFSTVTTGIYLLILPQYNDDVFRFNNNQNIVVAGDSRMERAFNDSVYTNAVNISQSAELYIFSFVKLQKVLDVNPHIDTVLLGLSYHNLSRLTDKWKDDEAITAARLPQYIPMMSVGDAKQLIMAAPMCTLTGFIESYKRYIERTVSGERQTNLLSSGIGGYLFVAGNLGDTPREKLTGFDEKLNTPSPIQITYLRKIIDLCSKRNVTLILVILPIHESSEYRNKNFTILDKYRTELGEVRIADYSRMALPDSCYMDETHFNYKGARVFSKLIKEKGIEAL